MRIVLATSVDPWTRSVATVHKYVAAGRALGHDIAVSGPPSPELPTLPFTTEADGADLVVFIVQVPGDIPDMPGLAHLIDRVPRSRRLAVDLWGRFNDTIRLEHDFNHLEKLDGHLGWEWEAAIGAVAGTILQPTLKPLRAGVKPFLFHAFDASAVVKPYASAAEAAAAWIGAEPADKPFGVMYAGSNWQRWHQVRPFLEQHAQVRDTVGPACLVGWDWGWRPDWAVEKGIAGIDTDPALLAALGVEVRNGVRFDEIPALLGQARFVPVFHRPLFRHLGLVTVRTFEAFEVDCVPVLMLPRDLVAAVYGDAALALVPDGDVGIHMRDALANPERTWQAVIDTRAHLTRHHSVARRLEQLVALATDAARAGAVA